MSRSWDGAVILPLPPRNSLEALEHETRNDLANWCLENGCGSDPLGWVSAALAASGGSFTGAVEWLEEMSEKVLTLW